MIRGVALFSFTQIIKIEVTRAFLITNLENVQIFVAYEYYHEFK